MKLLLITIVLFAGSFGFCGNRQPVPGQVSTARTCFECDPVPEATPTPTPGFTCFYVIVNGEKRLVCE